MYEEHFGLEKRPFSVKVTGTEVFVGPQTAKTMEGFRKALAVQDAVVTVSGPVGTGKTTLVERALNAIGSKYKTIRVGRMKMNSSDILEALLVVLGVQERPSGTIQRFGALRRKLQQLQDAETRVFVLVEDAVHAGAETLAELEALTDAEAGESDGASIVLMGDERLFDCMKHPELARLQQRVRRRHKIEPLCIAEMLGYLRHSFRVAGADYERIFDDRSAELFHRLSDGVPRVVNNLVEAVLISAAKGGMDKIPATFVAEIAAEEFGLTADGFDFSIPDPVEDGSPDAVHEVTPEPVEDDLQEPVVEAAAELAEDVTTEPAAKIAEEPLVECTAETAAAVTTEPLADEVPGPIAEPAEQPPVDAAPEPEDSQESPPVTASTDEAETSPDDSTDVPHLIDDTLPDLSILSKRYATLSQDDFAEPPDIVAETDDVNIHAESEARAADHDVEEIAADADTIVAEDADDLADVTPEPEPLGEVIAELAPESESPFEVLPELEAEPEPLTDKVPVLEALQESESDIVPVLEVAPQSAPDLVAEFTAEFEPQPVAEAEGDADDIPELTPASRHESEPVTEAVPEAEQRPTLEIVPDNPAPETAASFNGADSQDQTPEWDRDPTFAQLKPDLDALEQAMAYAHGEAMQAKAQTPPPEPESPAASIAEDDELPEITLDKSIETGIQDHLVEEPADIQPPQAARKSDVELGQIAANIANAKTLDDIDDIMAETLFGTSISMIAAAVTANPPSDEPANDELRLVEEETSATVEQAVQTGPLTQQIREEISLETPEPAANVGLDPTASQRLKTVRALNADLHPSLREPAKPRPTASSPPVSDEPQPIEDQINTSITQTLQALKVPPDMEDEEPEEEQKSGFFSRFRRSK